MLYDDDENDESFNSSYVGEDYSISSVAGKTRLKPIAKPYVTQRSNIQLTSLLNSIKPKNNPTPRIVTPTVPIRELDIAARMKETADAMSRYMESKGYNEIGAMTLSERFSYGIYDDVNVDKSGDAVLNDIMQVVTEFNDGVTAFRLRPDQWKMFSHILCSLLPFIYGKSLEENKDRVLAALGVKTIYEQVICVSSRRVGKTTVIAVICAALLICVPIFKGVIFAPSQRGSTRVREEIVRFLNMHERGRLLLHAKVEGKKDNTENLKLIGENPCHIKEFEILPGSPKVCSSQKNSIYFLFLLSFFSVFRSRKLFYLQCFLFHICPTLYESRASI